MPIAVYVLSASVFCLGTSEFMVAGLLPNIAGTFGVSIPSAGLLISGFALGMIVGAPTLALAGSRVARRRALVTALAVFAVGHFAAALAPSFAVLMAARVVTAMAAGAFWGIAAAAAAGLVPEAGRARAIAALMGGLTVANVAGVPLGTLVGEQLGWTATFWVVGGLAIVAAMAVWRIVPRGDSEHEDVRAELAVVRGRRIWRAYGAIVLFQGAMFCAFSYLAELATHVAGLSSGAVPIVLALNGLGACAGVTVTGRLAGRAPNGAMVVTSLTVAALLFGGLAVGGATPGLLVALVVLVAVAGFSAAPLLMNRVFEAAGRPSTLASAVATSAFNVGNMIGPWLGGLAIDAGLGYRAPPAIAGAGLLATAALVTWSLRRERAAAPGSMTCPDPVT